MSYRILCPLHKEKTPSCVVYSNSAYCFGCGKTFSLQELGIQGSTVKRTPTNIKVEVDRINQLPRDMIRGLELPFDELGYYIVWPNGEYYKRRNAGDDTKKYTNPIGRKQPLLKALVKGNKTLAIVEGELNALSLLAMEPYIKADIDIVSPGSASEIASDRYLQFYENYSKFIICTDKDIPGFLASLKLKIKLMSFSPYVSTVLLESDFNQMLQELGPENAAKEAKTKLGL